MCTAYKVGSKGHPTDERHFGEALAPILAQGAARIIRPTHKAPVVMQDGTALEMTWGFRRRVPAVKTKTRWQTIVNSREDKLLGRMWGESFSARRCLIPVSSFFEWVRVPGRTVPMEFEAADGAMLWVAGIWEHDEERGEVFSMITTEPSPHVGPVHDRMPAILSPSQIMPFLRFEQNDFGPSAVALRSSEAANFLSPTKGQPSSTQGELF